MTKNQRRWRAKSGPRRLEHEFVVKNAIFSYIGTLEKKQDISSQNH
jgi:hypothetical protein